jgi:phage-related protein
MIRWRRECAHCKRRFTTCERVEEMQVGHELRRPETDYLRDGVYELRVNQQGINLRMLYFFHGNVAAVLSHGLVKEKAVPPAEIDRAVARKQNFVQNPDRFTHREI